MSTVNQERFIMKQTLFSLFIVIFLCSNINADEVVLKKGNTISGTIISLNQSILKIETGYGTLDIPRNDIQSACIGSSNTAQVLSSTTIKPDTPSADPDDLKGLIGQYNLDGNAQDVSKNLAHGVLSGGLGFAENRYNQANKALNCEGKRSQYLKVEDHPGQHFQKFAISAWVTGNNPKLWARIIDKYIYNKKQGYALLYNHKDKTIAFDAWTTDNKNMWIQTTSKLAPGWQHICVTYNGKTLKIYYNGKQEAATPIEKTIQHTDRYLAIGNGYDGSNHFPWSGKIDDVRLFNQAMSDKDVQDLFNETQKDASFDDLKDKDSI